MTAETGLDVMGVGALAKAIPEKAWSQIVDTACKTFRETLAPFTAVTSGVGRLIDAKFDRLVDAEKVLAAETMARAQEKVSQSNKAPNGKAKARIVVEAIEASATETDLVLRELWSNLLAQEMVQGQVHPEHPKTLSRLSSYDAQVLAQIAERENDKSPSFTKALRSFSSSIAILGIALELIEPSEKATFTHEHLDSLNLIRYREGFWILTQTGRAFIRSVSDVWDD